MTEEIGYVTTVTLRHQRTAGIKISRGQSGTKLDISDISRTHFDVHIKSIFFQKVTHSVLLLSEKYPASAYTIAALLYVAYIRMVADVRLAADKHVFGACARAHVSHQ